MENPIQKKKVKPIFAIMAGLILVFLAVSSFMNNVTYYISAWNQNTNISLQLPKRVIFYEDHRGYKLILCDEKVPYLERDNWFTNAYHCATYWDGHIEVHSNIPVNWDADIQQERVSQLVSYKRENIVVEEFSTAEIAGVEISSFLHTEKFSIGPATRYEKVYIFAHDGMGYVFECDYYRNPDTFEINLCTEIINGVRGE